MRAFQSKKLNAKGNVLPYSQFKLFSDMKESGFDPKRMERIVAEAEKMLDTPIPMLPASLYREYVTNGNRSNYQNPYFKRRDMAIYLAAAEAFERKGRFAEKLMDAVWAIMEESSWVIPAHLYLHNFGMEYTLPPVYGNNFNHGIDLFAASTGANLAAVLYLASDALDAITPIICDKIRYSLRERIVRPYLESPFWWTGDDGRRVNNWNPWILSNVLFVTALTEESMLVREQVVNMAMRRLDNFINWYKPDGGCDEGPAYWGAAGASLFDCLEILEDMSAGRLTVYDVEIVKNIGDYIYKVNIDGTSFVNFADCAPKTSPNPSMLVRFGTKCNSDFLVSFGKKQAAYGDFFFASGHIYRSLKTLISPEIAPESCPMPRASYLPDLKIMTVRETSDSASGTFLAMKGGSNDEMHNHNDVGNFVVYRNGKPVIIDTGVGEYTKQTFSADRYKLWFMQSGYHNLPSFDGVDQHQGGIYASKDEVFDESIPSFRAELAGAYPKDAGVKSLIREARLDGGKVTVTDSFELENEKLAEFHYMCSTAPVLKEPGVISLAEGMTMTYDRAYECEIEQFDPVGMNTKGAWGTEVLYRIKLRIRATSASLTVVIE